MSDIGTPIASGSIPAVGSAGTAYASNLNLFLTEVKNRLEAEVPKTALADGPLDMNGEAVQNTSYVGVSDGAGAPTTPANSVQAFGGNMYWVNTGGAVQITSGTSLNTSLVGGITGDYGGANPAQFRFVDADQEYYAYDDYAGGAWARIWAKNFDIAAGSTSSVRARLAFGGGSSYTLTLPPAVPAEGTFMQMGATGAVTLSNTVPGTVTAATFKHTTPHNRWISHTSFKDFAAAHSYQTEYYSITNAAEIHIPVTVENDEKIEEFGVFMSKNSNAADTVTMRMWRINNDGTKTQVGTDATNVDNAPGATSIFKDGLTEVVGSGAGTGYVITIARSGAVSTVLLTGAYVYVSRP